jgi:predicted nucleic acid-binding protein
MEFLRSTGSHATVQMRTLIRERELATCDPVRLEVLAGARDERHLEQLEDLLGIARSLPIGSDDYDHAAYLYRACRRQGATVRSMLDCLIAAVAIGAGIPVLHADRDFDVLARHTRLEIA